MAVLAFNVAILTQAARSVAAPASAPAAVCDYKGATAHQPKFDDKAVWAGSTGKEAFAKQRWPKARLLVWAHPGENGATIARRGKHDPFKLENWIDAATGKGASSLPDENTDVLLPGSDTPYAVEWKIVGLEHNPRVVRHLTVGPNASWRSSGLKLHGNLWVQKGGSIGNHGATEFRGPGDTFYRVDSDGLVNCSQYFVFNKEKTASAEVIGQITMTDEFKIFGCTVIVAPDSKLCPGRNAHPFIADDGTLALLDGAYFGLTQNNIDTPDLMVSGNVQGGLPDRPLTRNCRFGVNFKNFTAAAYTGEGFDEKTTREATFRVAGLVVKQGSLRSYSTDLAKARLVINWNGKLRSKFRPDPNTAEEDKALSRGGGNKEYWDWFDKLPHQIDVWFGDGVTVDGVEFDDLHKGSLMLKNPADKAKWKNVFFGSNCAAKGDELYRQLDKLDRSGGY